MCESEDCIDRHHKDIVDPTCQAWEQKADGYENNGPGQRKEQCNVLFKERCDIFSVYMPESYIHSEKSNSEEDRGNYVSYDMVVIGKKKLFYEL